MWMRVRAAVVAWGAVVLLAPTGCALSESVSTSLDSLSGMSASLSRSSESSSEQETAYRGDVIEVAVAWVEVAPLDAGLLGAVGEVARSHGITDWEGLPATYVSLGEGLRRGGAEEAAVRAFARDLIGGDAEGAGLLLEGYGA